MDPDNSRRTSVSGGMSMEYAHASFGCKIEV